MSTVTTAPPPPHNGDKGGARDGKDGKRRGGSVKRRLALSKTDWRAVEYVRAKHAVRTFSEAVRLCVQQQDIRDRVCGAPAHRPEKGCAALVAKLLGGEPDAEAYRELAGRVFASASAGRPRGDAAEITADASLRQWLCRFWPADEQALQGVISRWALDHVVDAVRFCVRVQAAGDGFAPPGGVWV